MVAFRQQIHSWRNPDLVIRFREVSLLVAGLEGQPDIDPGTKEQARTWLADARNILQQRLFGILLYDRYDAAWAMIHQLRHLLCTVLPARELLALLVDIRSSTAYLGNRQREACERDLLRLEQELLPRAAGAGTAAGEPMNRVRAELESWSRRVAGAREAHWRKVNLLRKRLAVTGSLLVALLGMAWCLLPGLLAGASGAGISRLQLGGIMLLGAIGGLVSALWSKEALHATSSQFYLQRTLLALKPVIGAATAIFAVLLQKAGIVSLLPASADQMTAYLVLAFLAGFSERFVRTRIEEASSPAASAASPVAEAAEPKGRKGQQ